MVNIQNYFWGLFNLVSNIGLCMSLSSVTEQKAKWCLLLTVTQTFPSVFYEMLSALLVPHILLSISFSVSKRNLLEITESLQVLYVNSVSFKIEQISHLQTQFSF